MKRNLLALSLVLRGFNAVYAQSPQSTNAAQTTNLSLSDAIEIHFVSTASSTGSIVTLPFTDVNDYADGVESAGQQIRVRSNKDFDVRMESNANYFTYSGNATSNNLMRVKDVLKMKIAANNTGGSVSGGFGNYKKVDDDDKKILNNCDKGDRDFTIQYKASPGFEYPAGTYTVDVIFTATQD